MSAVIEGLIIVGNEVFDDEVLVTDMAEIAAAGSVTSLIEMPPLVYTHRHLGVATGT